MNWTPKDLDSYYGRLKKHPVPAGEYVIEAKDAVMDPNAPMVTRPGTKDGRAIKERMNRWEREYAQILENSRIVGDVLWWGFEAMKLRLAGNTYYTPDFAVLRLGVQCANLEFREVKGFWREDARIKIKVAAEHFPFKFIAVTKVPQKQGGGWKVEEFNGIR